VLSTWTDPDDVAGRFGLTVEDLLAKLDEARPKLLAEREKRVRPGLDDKVLASWNGLALGAFAEAARVFGDSHYEELARQNAVFLRARLWREGRLLHTYTAGIARVAGMLEDYGYLGLGLVELFKLTGDLAHLEWARELLDLVIAEFHDAEGGAFFETAAGGERLLMRPKPLFDGATPSGNAAVGQLAHWIGRYYGQEEYEAFADEVVGAVSNMLLQAPSGFGAALQLVELRLAPRQELAVVGPAESRAALEREAASRFLPWLAIAPSERGEGLPVFEGREWRGGPALAYLCEDFACQLPAGTAEALGAQLDGRASVQD
jgi:uncharacterized protein YyaL (SSP411 family)